MLGLWLDLVLRVFSHLNESIIKNITYQFDRQCQKLQHKNRESYLVRIREAGEKKKITQAVLFIRR